MQCRAFSSLSFHLTSGGGMMGRGSSGGGMFAYLCIYLYLYLYLYVYLFTLHM